VCEIQNAAMKIYTEVGQGSYDHKICCYVIDTL